MHCLDKGQVWLVRRGRKKTAKIRWSSKASRGSEHRTVEYKIARRAEMGKEGGVSEELKRRQSLTVIKAQGWDGSGWKWLGIRVEPWLRISGIQLTATRTAVIKDT